MLKIIISKQAAQFLEKIPHKHAVQITSKITQLAHDPNSLPTKQLEGYKNYRRAKSGEYRIIYRIQNEVVTLHILRVGKRNDGEVYKNLDNLE